MIDLKSRALLLVDLQNDFLAKGGYYDRKEKYAEKVRQGHLSYEKMRSLLSKPSLAPEPRFKFRKESLNKMLGNIINVTEFAIKNEMTIIYLKAIYNHNFNIKPPIFKKNPSRLDYPCKRGTWGVEFIHPINNLTSYGKVVEKNTFDGFYKTNLYEFLRINNKIETVLITGVETHICVLITAQSASLNQFTTIILEDCVASAREDLALWALKIFQDGFGEVRLSTDILVKD